jgi:hypothetical protein
VRGREGDRRAGLIADVAVVALVPDHGLSAVASARAPLAIGADRVVAAMAEVVGGVAIRRTGKWRWALWGAVVMGGVWVGGWPQAKRVSAWGAGDWAAG